MSGLKQMILATCLLLILTLAGEFLMNVIFEDNTPLWKILSVSAIATVGTMYPLIYGKEKFEIDDILKNQSRTLNLIDGLNLSEVDQFIRMLKASNYSNIKHSVKDKKVTFSSKPGWETWGGRYTIHYAKSTIQIKSRGKIYIDFFDSGQTSKEMNEIERLINTLVTSKLKT